MKLTRRMLTKFVLRGGHTMGNDVGEGMGFSVTLHITSALRVEL